MKMFILSLFLFPFSAFADRGLVTCDGVSVVCNACTLISMVNGLVQWLFTILALLAVMMMVYAGFKLVVSQGNSHAWGEAKGMLTNVIVGFVIVLSAWLIVDTLMKMLVSSNSGLGMWNSLETDCGK